MANFLFVYYGGMPEDAPAPTPKQQKEMDAAWTGWFKKLGKAVVEMGAPTKPGKTVAKGGAKPTGGDAVGGYSIIKAASLGAAVKLAQSNPYVSKGLKIAVHELIPM